MTHVRAFIVAAICLLPGLGMANTPPTIKISMPAVNSTFIAPASITLLAYAADSDGAIGKVHFHNGGAYIGTGLPAPGGGYTLNWGGVPAGSYSLTATAYDMQGASATTPPVTITVTPPNLSPSVSFTAPAAGSSHTAPASITLAATATDSDGSIAAVEFYNGAALIGTGTLTGGSYTHTWSNVAAGSYSLRAQATDNEGAVTTSAPVVVTVTDPPPPAVAAGVYYVYADHLNTPRVITDGTNKVVWRWDSDPFGADAANEDPDGDGTKFRYNLRFPGQYYDGETGLHYNYFRDYDSTTGRYVESDPLGIIPIDISPLIKQAKYLLGTKEKDLSELVLDHHAHDGYKVNHPYAYAISNPIIFSDFFWIIAL